MEPTAYDFLEEMIMEGLADLRRSEGQIFYKEQEAIMKSLGSGDKG